ncbi:MAG: hypothetical protein F4X99_21430 [Gammaproteobacteria bacterium]|nr:hypothetical protein [Gammaproteobacteria bacterium]
MAEDALNRLGKDHADWLLVAAHNDLRQQRAERATALLELLGVLDADNLQGQKMLAYAYWLQRDVSRCAALVDRILDRPLGDPDRAAMAILNRRLGRDGALPNPTGVADGTPPP